MNRRIFLLSVSIFLSSSLFAEKISFSANSMSGKIGDKSDSTSLIGEAYVLTDSMEISADSISMSGKDFRYIDAVGKIKGKNMDSELEFTCGKMHYDRETKIAKLSEDVTLIDEKNDVNAKAQLIEYNQDTDIAIIQINIELKQKDNVCTGAYALYRKAEQKLELSGNAQIKQGSDTFRAQEIILDLDSQEITLDGRVKGSVVDERKSKNEEETEAEAPESSKSADSTEEVQEEPAGLEPPKENLATKIDEKKMTVLQSSATQTSTIIEKNDQKTTTEGKANE